MKKILLALVVVLAAALLAFGVYVSLPRKAVEEVLPPSQEQEEGAATPTSGPAQVEPDVAPDPKGVKKGFVNFVNVESQSLNATEVDADEAEKRMAREAVAMGPEEMRYAAKMALSNESAAGKRILAAYLLGAAGRKAWPVLKEVILAPLTEKGGEPHTEGELKAMQEKAIRVMAVDALVEQAQKDPGAWEELVRLSAEVQDAGIRHYILERLKERPSR